MPVSQRHPATLAQQARHDPGSLAPRDLLQLQTVVGNKPLGRLLAGTAEHQPARILQREINHDPFQPDPAGQAELDAIDRLVAEYNAACGGRRAETKEGLRARFSRLMKIDRKVYQWFSAKQVPDLLSVPNGREMRSLLLSTERERDSVVEKLRLKGASITFANLEPGESPRALEALWKKIAAQGESIKLRIRGSPADQQQLLGRLASIMQTKTGRAFIRFISEKSPQTITIMFTDAASVAEGGGAMPLAYAAEARGVVGEGAEEKVRVAEPSAPTKMKRLPGRQGAKAIADSAAGFIEQLLAEASKKPGKRPSEFKAGEQRYGRGTGKEAAAVVSRAEVLVEKREYLSTAQGFEVLTPTFITLMHELGHALKIAIGGYMPDDEDLMSHFVSHLPALQQRWWAALKGRPNMLEELVNILGIEKPVREESGLAPREIYQATREVKVDAAREKLRAVMGRDPDDSAYMDDIIGPLYAKITPSISLTDVEQLLTDIDAITPAVQARAKADYAQTLKTDLEGFLHDEPDNQRRVRRTRRYQALHAQLEHIVRNPDITAIQLQGLPQKLQALKDDKALLVKAGMLIKSFQTGGFRSKFAKRVHEGGDIRDYVPT